MSDTDVNAIVEQLKDPNNIVPINNKEYYIAEGDLLLRESEVLAYAIRRASLSQAATSGLSPDRLLVVADEEGHPIRWAKGLVLSYTVLRATFPSDGHYQLVVTNMAAAAAAWAGTCGVTFSHLAELDTSSDGKGALFTVQYTDVQGKFIAAAFFPTWPQEERIVHIDPSYFSETLQFNKVGVLRHELGHVLGFRHEHIRSGAPPECFEESLANTVALSKYDPQSVMHYFCGGVGTKELDLTEIDRRSARGLYGPPDREVRYRT